MNKVANKSEVFKVKKKKAKMEEKAIRKSANDIFQNKKGDKLNLDAHKDLQAECNAKLNKNLKSYPFLLLKTAEVE